MSEKCYFSTGVCETVTCCKDGRFNEYGYPENRCPQYPCLKIKRIQEQTGGD